MHRKYQGSRGLLLGNAIFNRKKMTIKTDKLRLGDGVTLYRNNKKIGGFRVEHISEKDNFCVISNLPFQIQKGKYQLYKTNDREFNSFQKMIQKLKFPSVIFNKKRCDFNFTERKRSKKLSDLSFYISSLKSLDAVLPYADRIYFELKNDFKKARDVCEETGIEFVLMMPRLSFSIPNVDVKNLMICSLGQFEKYSDRNLFGHYSFNFFNSFTIPELYQNTLSVELAKKDVKEIAHHYSGRLEIMVFGKIELMVSRDPSLYEGTLVDQRRKKFSVYRDQFGFVHILNSSDLLLLDYLDEIEEIGIDSFGIDLRRRSVKLCKIVAKTFYKRDLNNKQVIKKKCKLITTGHYLRGVY
jgi:putative protease